VVDHSSPKAIVQQTCERSLASSRRFPLQFGTRIFANSDRMKTIVLLTISNVFMNLAWYGHLKFKNQPLWLVILASWGIALFEYMFQVPANRVGSNQWTLPQLKVLQECITLVVFSIVAFALFRSPVRWNYFVSYGLIIGAVYFAFKFQ
jgi:uncharacterized protein (DUF486 family)